MKSKIVIVQAALVVGLMVFAGSASAALMYFDAQIYDYYTSSKSGPVLNPYNTIMLNSAGADMPFTYYPLSTGSGYDHNDGAGAQTQPDGNWTNVGPSYSGQDNLWRRRPAANFGSPNADPAGDVLEARGGSWDGPNPEDCPVLKTTVGVPVEDQGTLRGVYVLAWSDGAAWRVAASLDQPAAPNDMVVYRVGWDRKAYNYVGATTPVANSNLIGPGLSGYVWEVFDASQVLDPPWGAGESPALATNYPMGYGGTPPGSGDPQVMYMGSNLPYTSSDAGGAYATPPGSSSTGRHLWAVWLGNVELGTELSVYVGDGVALSATEQTDSGNHRVWYDGIAYGDPQPLEPLIPIPEPASAVLLAIALVGLSLARRRR